MNPEEEEAEGKGTRDSRVDVCLFDSVDNFLSTMRMISALCGSLSEPSFDPGEVERFSSTITFLKEWKHFYFEPKVVKFGCETGLPHSNDANKEVRLPQFSSAAVPEFAQLSEKTELVDSMDFILYAGGQVWALDWCPRIQSKTDSTMSCEYLAVAAHPPGASYHKIGAPLIGRGAIQIWCLVTPYEDVDVHSSMHRRGKTKKGLDDSHLNATALFTASRPRGRPLGSVQKKNVGPLPAEDGSKSPWNGGRPSKRLVVISKDVEQSCSKRPRGRPRKCLPPGVESSEAKEGLSLCNSNQIVCVNTPIAPLCVESGEMIVVLPVSTNLNSQKPISGKRRGRPRKESLTSREEHFLASGAKLQEDTTMVPILSNIKCMVSSQQKSRGRPRKLGTINKKHNSPVVGIESRKDTLQLPILADNSRGESIERRRRGRPRKNWLLIEQKCAPAAAVELGAVSLAPMLIDNGSNHIENIHQSTIPSRIDSADVAPALQLSSHGNCKEETSQRRRRGRPRKQKNSSEIPSLMGPSVINTVIENTDQSGVPSAISVLALPLQASPDQNHNGESRQRMDLTASRHKDMEGEKKNISSQVSITNHEDRNISIGIVGAHDVDCQDMTTVKNRVTQRTPMPSLVICLAHNGKVAWDIKWRPSIVNCSEPNRHMGHLAALLGNGSLEVWEVPFPSMVHKIYYSTRSQGTDPRFLKLEPVFRCSEVKCGNRQSIPLTVEWSPCPPHDMILAGCHDGTVALWKFSVHSISQDSRPLICFAADSVPIRTLSWAPYFSDEEDNSNLFVTAGHEGLKFWDIRDPFHPLWELNPTQRAVLSLDWLKNPRCLIISLDDGTVKVLNLSDAAYDVPTTGRSFVGKKFRGLYSYPLSAFAIWNVQVSQRIGLVAYCSADGSAARFQLNARFVEKDPRRNNVQCFLCGSFGDEGQVITINSPMRNSPLPNVPLSLKKPPIQSRDIEQTVSGDFLDTTQANNAKPADPDNEAAQGNNSRDEHSGYDAEVFPPKVMAMHRVRWNTNKGSERWLCYGGAAGIVRCQKIPLPLI